MNDDFQNDDRDRIAIIGMAGRFPGAADLAQFWRNLHDGVESISFFSRDQLAAAGVPPALLDNPNYVPANGVLDGIELFDAEFFGFTPREAEITDPQHRVFLECAWEALETAGYDSCKCDGRIGVYAGAGPSHYLLYNLLQRPDLAESWNDVQLFIGTNKDFVPSRVCYKLDLKGPGISVTTACSSSLVAVHVACQALLDFQCDMALAGGVGIQVPQHQGYLYHEGGIGSPDGHCRVFDARARGTVSGNGVGIVVLKRLEEALADGDQICAVIFGSAVNNDGADKVGYTAPSVSGQAAVIAEAHAVAGVDPRTIGYVEAHGTGTPLGDPVEIAALNQAFGNASDHRGRCAIGSLKSNVGHLDEAAGVAGLIKTVLALQHNEIPPSLHYERANPEIDFDRGPFFVNQSLSPWPGDGIPRRAGVSSFGIGGTNAHVVVQEAPRPKVSGAARPWQLLPLSARTAAGLDAVAARLAQHLEQHPAVPLADVAYTLGVGRREWDHRRIVLAADRDDAVQALVSPQPDRAPAVNGPHSKSEVVLMFPGQGAQHVNMGRELYRHESGFRDTLDRGASVLKRQMGIDLRALLFPDGNDDATARRLAETAIAQPAIFLIEYCLAKLWMSWGVNPTAFIGHSLGEYVAACLAGVFSLDDALSLVAYRGKLMQQLPAGAMLAVPLPEDELREMIGADLSLAVVNAPNRCVVSGDLDAIAKFESVLAREDTPCRRLQTSHAFHSAMVEPMLDEFRRHVERAALRVPEIPYLSNLTGNWISPDQATAPDYWASQLRNTVRFDDGLCRLLNGPHSVFLEAGPGQTLTTLAQRHPQRTSEQVVLASMPEPREGRSDLQQLLETAGRLWLAGVPLQWREFYAHQERRRVPLPTYPFEKRRYWIDPPVDHPAHGKHDEPGPAADGLDISDWFYIPAWEEADSLPAASVADFRGDSWLIFDDGRGIGAHSSERLLDEGIDVFTVIPGDVCKQIREREYTINPCRRDDYVELISALSRQNFIPSHILHAWNVTPGGPAQPDAARLNHERQRGFDSLLWLALALHRAVDEPQEVKVTVVSNHLHRVKNDDPLAPHKAMLLGPIRVIPLEFPRFDFRSVDVVLPDSGSWVDSQIPQRLFEEILHAPVDRIIALREGSRYRPCFRSQRLDSPTETPRLKERGVYLITGGLGSMGLAFAHKLAMAAKAKLVLTTRSPFPSREEWDDRLAADDSCEASARSTAFDLARLSTAVENLEAASTSDLAIRGLDSYPGVERCLNEFCASLLARYVAGGTPPDSQASRVSIDCLKNRLRIQPRFDKFFDFMLNTLAEAEGIAVFGDEIDVTRLGAATDPELLRNEIVQHYPEFSGLVDLLSHCARQYPAALSGEVEAISVLYPDGTPALLDEFGRRTAQFENDAVYLAVAAGIVKHIVTHSAGRKIRILEVGGGTGSLSRRVVPALAEHAREVEYHFTDIGPSFVRRAQEEAEAGGFDYMRFGVFDIAKDPQPQGYAPESFDVVLGYNVMHAVPNVTITAASLHRLLAPGGLMLLVETVAKRRWQDMIWGLAEGWWCFDDDLRSRSPLLGLAEWETLVRACGFPDASAFPRLIEKRELTDAGLIVAQKQLPLDREATHSRPGADAASAAKVHGQLVRLRELERQGAEVLIVQADAADVGQMKAALSVAQNRFGPINGVIHTAGVLGQGLALVKSSDEIEEVLAAKAKGACVLGELLQDSRPDFFVLCSSLAAHLPISGQVDYCAANAYLDAYAAWHQEARGIPTISIGWGFWQELGMIDKAKAPAEWKRQILREIRERGWDNAGVDALWRILGGCGSSQILVSPQDIREQVQLAPAVEAPAQSTSSDTTVDEAPVRRTLSGHPLFHEHLIEAGDRETFVSFLSTRHWMLNEHRLFGKAVLPGTAYLELARAAYSHRGNGGAIEMREVFFLNPLVLDDDERREVHTIIQPRQDGFDFHVASRIEPGRDAWQEHACGELRSLNPAVVRQHDLQALAAVCDREDLSISTPAQGAASDTLEARVNGFGLRWRCLRRLQCGTGQALATLSLPAEIAGELADYGLHPGLLDIATGIMAVKNKHEEYLPFRYRRVVVRHPLTPTSFSHIRYADVAGSDEIVYDVSITSEQGVELVEVEGYTLKKVGAETAAVRQLLADHGQLSVFPERANFALEIISPGNLQTLEFRQSPRRPPDPGEVEVELQAAGLNFIEVLYALGMLPDPGWHVQFGLEGAGRVSAVGVGVRDFAVGDDVLMLCRGCFAQYATTSVANVARTPARLSAVEAATIPAAYVTAYYSLVTRASLRSGERILIHAATGGVGLAAVHVARWIGAEIYATAGTTKKRAFLRSLGISHVMDSRSLGFADEVMQRSGGDGVDVVLNSLGGEFIAKGLSVLRRHGRFLELGKRDIFANTPLGMGVFEKHIALIAIDAGNDLPDFENIWREVMRRVAAGDFPALPLQTFPVRQAPEAFAHMARAGHIGKIVIEIEADDSLGQPIGRYRPVGAPRASIVGRPYVPAANHGSAAGRVAHPRPDLPTPYREPQTDAERDMAGVWQDLLGMGPLGVDDNFFDLRGDSLLAAQMMSRIGQMLHVKLPLSAVFDAPTIADLAASVDRVRQSARELQATPVGVLEDDEEEGEL